MPKISGREADESAVVVLRLSRLSRDIHAPLFTLRIHLSQNDSGSFESGVHARAFSPSFFMSILCLVLNMHEPVL